MEFISEIILKFGTEMIAGGLVLAFRWIEKRRLKSSFLRKLKEVREMKENSF